MKQATFTVLAVLLAIGATLTRAQDRPPTAEPATSQLTETGTIAVGGETVRYVIHRLPVSSFPSLPSTIQGALNQRGCLIPQTYEAHRPENVVHGSLEHPGTSDWAVLCSAQGTVSLLVFFGSAPERPVVLATSPETERLQSHDPSGVFGFNWGIDPASPEQVHEAQSGLEHRPQLVDHDALVDSVVERRNVYHFYAKGVWTLLDMPE